MGPPATAGCRTVGLRASRPECTSKKYGPPYCPSNFTRGAPALNPDFIAHQRASRTKSSAGLGASEAPGARQLSTLISKHTSEPAERSRTKNSAALRASEAPGARRRPTLISKHTSQPAEPKVRPLCRRRKDAAALRAKTTLRDERRNSPSHSSLPKACGRI